MVFTLIIAFALAIVAAIFALQNPTMVTANFFGYLVDGSLALFVLIGLAVGFAIGVLVMTPGRIKSGLANTRNRKKIVELENSIRKSSVPAPVDREAYPPVVEEMQDEESEPTP
ncbi:MAG: LapA family protein [Anaerolineaceae bacterium]|nr:MAG: LapA family protein [Anaerolineaceae bacterium]